MTYAYVAFLSGLTVLSIRTIVILKASAPWTSAGWAATIAYDCAASAELTAHTHLPVHAPYIFLGALAIAFVIAGLRDEPQGDPWYWPTRLGPTRAARIPKA